MRQRNNGRLDAAATRLNAVALVEDADRELELRRRGRWSLGS
jgi:hypothetical protein